jgi:hypothetical protein
MTSSETVHRMIDDLPPELRSEVIPSIEEVFEMEEKIQKEEVPPYLGRGAFPSQKKHNGC